MCIINDVNTMPLQAFKTIFSIPHLLLMQTSLWYNLFMDEFMVKPRGTN